MGRVFCHCAPGIPALDLDGRRPRAVTEPPTDHGQVLTAHEELVVEQVGGGLEDTGRTQLSAERFEPRSARSFQPLDARPTEDLLEDGHLLDVQLPPPERRIRLVEEPVQRPDLFAQSIATPASEESQISNVPRTTLPVTVAYRRTSAYEYRTPVH